MGYNRNSRMSQAQQVLDRLTADKKKTVFAVSLLAIMGFMWFRVLTGHRPGPAAAETHAGQEQSQPQQPQRDIRYVELPVLPGRNDYINRDFFASRDWECFRQNSATSQGPGTRVQVVASDPGHEAAARVGQKLKLGAVLTAGNPQASINDRLLKLGDRFTVRDGPDTCEFEVLRIYEDSVLVGCNGTQLTLKLIPQLDVDK